MSTTGDTCCVVTRKQGRERDEFGCKVNLQMKRKSSLQMVSAFPMKWEERLLIEADNGVWDWGQVEGHCDQTRDLRRAKEV